MALAVCCTAAATPPVAAEAARASGWMIVRTGRGAAPLTGTFVGHAANAEATAVLFALSGSGTSRRLAGAFTTGRIDWGADGWPRVYGSLQPDCPAPACADPLRTRAGYGFSSNGHPLDAVVYVATSNVVESRIDVTSPGWVVRPWRPTLRTVSTEEAGTVGVRATHTAAGEFRGGQAAGGRHGSIGWARLPCDNHGEGRADFTGGQRTARLDCASRLSAMSVTTRATTWRVTGSVTGVGSTVNVLVAVDFPR